MEQESNKYEGLSTGQYKDGCKEDNTFHEKKTAPEWFQPLYDSNFRFTGGDHVGYSKNGEVVLQPYMFDMSGMKKLIEECERYKLTFCVDTKSHYNQGRTLSVRIKPREDFTPIPSENPYSS